MQGALNTADHDLLLAIIWLPCCHWYTALRLPGHFYSLCLVLPHVNSGREDGAALVLHYAGNQRKSLA